MFKYRVVLFEDNPHFVMASKALLQESIFQLVGSFPDCSGLSAILDNLKPDIIIMDIDLPGKNGIEAVQEIRASGFLTPILMQTIFDEEEKIFNSLLAGANGYILKTDVSEKLIEALNDVLKGGTPLSSSVATKVVKLFHYLSLEKQQESTVEDYKLTAREKEVLGHLSNGYSYKMIADMAFISYGTVHSHIKNIYKKLHVASMTEAVSKAIKEKLI